MEELVKKYFNEDRIKILVEKLKTSNAIEILTYKKVGSRNSEIHDSVDQLIDRFNLILKDTPYYADYSATEYHSSKNVEIHGTIWLTQ
jgi:hypothetical protein